jgi:hypothetical protein
MSKQPACDEIPMQSLDITLMKINTTFLGVSCSFRGVKLTIDVDGITSTSGDDGDSFHVAYISQSDLHE